MSSEKDYVKHVYVRTPNEKYERLLEYLANAFGGDKAIIFNIPEKSQEKEEKPSATNQQLIELSSEILTLKNQLNKYLKVEIREESVRVFSSLISQIEEINEVYAQHNINGIIFWIIYDRGDRLEILEKLVDIECEFEKLFNNFDFDYRLLPISSKSTRIQVMSEPIYLRK